MSFLILARSALEEVKRMWEDKNRVLSKPATINKSSTSLEAYLGTSEQ